MSAKITIGLNSSTQKALPIRDAGNGLGVVVIALTLESLWLQIRERKKIGISVTIIKQIAQGGLEPALHKLAKEIIAESEYMVFPKYGKLTYQNPNVRKNAWIVQTGCSNRA